MFRFFLGFFFAAGFISLFAQEDIETQVNRGLELSYNFQWEKSDEVFQKLIDKYPDDPRGFFFRSRNSMWAYLSNRSKNDYDEFFRFSDIALQKAEQAIDKNSKDEISLFICGTSYNYRGVVFGKAESYVKAIWAFKKSDSYLKELTARNKQFYDAYFGLGIYNLVLSEIPSAFKWALKTAGLSGDKNTGLYFLKLAAQNGKYLKAEAQYYLSQIYSDNLLNFSASSALLKKLTEQYPQNALFQYSYSALLFRQRKLDEAESMLNKLLKTEFGKKFKQIKAYADFSLGDIHYRQNNFSKAVEFYNKFLKANAFQEYTGIVYLRLGVSYENINDRTNAVRCYANAQKGNQAFQEDVYAKRKGEIFQKRTIAETEFKVIKGENLIEAGRFQEAVSILKDALQSIKTERLKAEAFLYLSDALYNMGNFSESIEYAGKIKNMNLEDEKWILPFSFYYKARAMAKTGNFEETKSCLSDAEAQNRFDFEKKLNILINNLSGTIKH